MTSVRTFPITPHMGPARGAACVGVPWAREAPAGAVPSVPGPELPGIRPRHALLPDPPPSLDALARAAAAAPTSARFAPGAHPSTIANAHYTNTRSQLAFALSGAYNSVEGDVRMRSGLPVMAHDRDAPADLTFEQWAILAHRAGKHLRIDLKEAAAIPHVARTLEQLRVPSGSVTFNVGIISPWSRATVSADGIRALRARFPESWITLNLPLPFAPGMLLAERFARSLRDPRLGVAVLAGLASAADVRTLRRSFGVVNAWNVPQLGTPDLASWRVRLRAMGVNGMVDLRRADDPLATD